MRRLWAYFFNPQDTDADKDGVLDTDETDTDKDGVPDEIELDGETLAQYGTDEDRGGVPDAQVLETEADLDGDGVSDLDTDGDGIPDDVELGMEALQEILNAARLRGGAGAGDQHLADEF